MESLFRTELCQNLGIDYPVFQGGMAWVATGELAGAVSAAGGLGIIGAGNASAGVVAEEIDKIKTITDKPFGVNVMLLSPFVEEIVDLVTREEVPVITTGAGNPGKYISRFKEAGCQVVPVVSSVALARRMARLDISGVIAEGGEAGGHVGRLNTMAMIPQIVDAVDVPVIAAGGIADGRGLLAAITLGAQGVQLGTRFVCCEECTASQEYKEAIIKAKDRSTVVTGRSTGHPVRVLKNIFTRELEKMEARGCDPEEIEEFGEDKLRQAVCEGKVNEGSVMAGQIAGLIEEVLPAGEIIENMIREARQILESQCQQQGAERDGK